MTDTTKEGAYFGWALLLAFIAILFSLWYFNGFGILMKISGWLLMGLISSTLQWIILAILGVVAVVFIKRYFAR